MTLKELLNVCEKSVVLVDAPNKDSLIDNCYGDLTPYEEYEIINIKAFYNRTGLFKYGLIVEVTSNE